MAEFDLNPFYCASAVCQSPALLAFHQMEAQWESLYARLKKDIQDTRKSGKKCTETDLNRYEDRFNKLDQSLQIIKASPMEYEV